MFYNTLNGHNVWDRYVSYGWENVQFNEPTLTCPQVFRANAKIVRTLLKPGSPPHWVAITLELLKFVVPTIDDVPWLVTSAKIMDERVLLVMVPAA